MAETGVDRRSSVTKRLIAAVAIAAAAAGATLLSGCSPGVDYPSLFPAVHDMPPPRADTPLDPVEIRQATEDLITARDHLNASAPGSGQASASENAAKQAAAKKKQSVPQSAAKPAATGTAPAAAPRPPASATGGTQTAGAEPKP